MPSDPFQTSFDDSNSPRESTELFRLPAGASARLSGLPLGEILLAQRALTPEKLAEALLLQKEKGVRIGALLVSLKAITDDQVALALGAQLDIPVLTELRMNDIELDLVRAVPINFARQTKTLPLRREGETALVAMADPLDVSSLDHLRVLLKMPVEPRIVTEGLLIDALNAAYDRAMQESGGQLDDALKDGDEDLDELAHDFEEQQDLLDAGDDEAPIIRLVNSLLKRAVKEKVSDIHIEPYDREVVVRFRKDGVLHEIIKPQKRFQKAIASRVKIMGQLNIAETRLPQDGRIRIKIAGRDIDIRLSTVPTSHGERIVMRLLDKSAVLLNLEDLGFSTEQLGMMETLIGKSHGIILVTGPTGSGKTTTLYAALSRINKPDLNILTAEDPVEYQLTGIGQTPVNAKIGLTFAGALRSFLRQDPDVIMVGEIRDLETAEIAIQASLTGHLVFSTVHTNDAPGAITRLVDMGVEPFLVASSLVGILAQRLVRHVCKKCRIAYVPSADELSQVGLSMADFRAAGVPHIYKASEQGCDACEGTGHKGRMAIYEMMFISDDVRQLILKNVDSNTIKKKAMEQGMRTLIQDGARKILQGETTIAEVLWVAQQDAE
ncbi:MAG: type II secretion system ATPase GspE [Myxococcales bacterium]|jgi:general secretion pathway protein E|nr:type II secretion system ATPase GspE [Myxococcales bacterium]